MSFVVSVIEENSFIIAGDTQLNDDNGKIDQTGIKVFPIDPSFVIGITGDYFGYLSVVNRMISENNSDLPFAEKIKLLNYLFYQESISANVIAVGRNKGNMYFTTMSDKTKWHYTIETVKGKGNASVKFLLPPDVEERFCYPFFSNLNNLQNSVINCIRAVSKKSASVNDSIFGVMTKGTDLQFFTNNIDYNKIDYRINAIDPQ